MRKTAPARLGRPPPRSRRGSLPRWSSRSAPSPPRLLAPPRSTLRTPPPRRSGRDPSKPALEISRSYRKRPRREASSPPKSYVVELEIEPRRAIAEVAANSRSDPQFSRKFPLGFLAPSHAFQLLSSS